MSHLIIQTEQGYRIARAVTAPPLKNLPPAVYEIILTPNGIEILQYSTKMPVPKKILGKETPSRIKTINARYARKVKTESTGVLLHGLPGTGKTILANSLCNSMLSRDRPVFIINSPLPGEVLKSVCQAVGSCAMLFDEVTRTYPIRDGHQTMDTLVTYLSDETLKGVMNIMITNDADQLPNALIRRPGRARSSIKFAGASNSEIDDIYASVRDHDITAPLVRTFKNDNGLRYDEHKAVVEEIVHHENDEDLALALDDLNISSIYIPSIELNMERKAPTKDDNGDEVKTYPWQDNVTYVLLSLFCYEVTLTLPDGSSVTGLCDVSSTSSIGDLRTLIYKHTNGEVNLQVNPSYTDKLHPRLECIGLVCKIRMTRPSAEHDVYRNPQESAPQSVMGGQPMHTPSMQAMSPRASQHVGFNPSPNPYSPGRDSRF